MKFSFEIRIDADLETVWEAFDDAGKLDRWQPTLESVEHRSGTPGEPGAVSELTFDENGRKILMKETLTELRKPHFKAVIYESDFHNAIVVNHFKDTGDTTLWTMHANHRFKGFGKLMAIFIAGSIRKRIEEDMNRFKLLVETEQANAAS